MNLLSLLLNSLMTDSSISALAKKTGLNKDVLKKLVPLAIPILIKFMTNNASSQAGAASLLEALGQHTSRSSLAEQIDAVDTEDGIKIIGHIFGDQSDAVISDLALQTGLNTQDVSVALADMAPAVLSGLSAANGAAASAPVAGVDFSDGIDLSELMTLFTGMSQSQVQSQPTPSGLFSGLLGGGSNGLGGGLLGSLLGSTSQQPDNDSTVNGTHLLSLLSSLM